MTTPRWEHVEALLDRALDLPPSRRHAFLEEACGNDRALFDEVASLLEQDTDGDDLAGFTTDDLLNTYAGAFEVDAPPVERVGPYHLLRELGRGGMGRVFLARREDVETEVALKLLPRLLATPEHRERFLFERRVLARLRHPHIARFLDAGFTDDGLPFFVMEYVAGTSLTTYCNDHHLGVDARLELFLSACDAVQYAHQNLVVHRDLKPSNILVTEAGVVKLLDFGIAKLLEPGGAQPETRPDQRLLTPEYAAPEQLRGDDVTTATDVYSLGVLLYEVLTGQRPFAPDAPRREPLPPSQRLRSLDDAPALVRNTGVTHLERLRQRLRGDLDLICLKALSPDPARRYASAEQLAADLRLHLAGFPVTAQAPTLTYRARKFVDRHRVGVLLSALVVLLLVGFGLRERTLRARAEEARLQAIAQTRTKDAVVDFLTSLFHSANPFSSEEIRGDSVTVGQVLAIATRRLDTELTDQPAVRSALWLILAQVYERLTRYDDALALARRALALREETYGARDTSVAEAQMMVGFLLQAERKSVEAEPYLRKALDTRRALLGEDHLETARSYLNLGMVLLERSRIDEAEAAFRRAYDTRRARLDSNDTDLAEASDWLALALINQERLDEAVALRRRGLEITRANLGEDHPDVGTYLNNLAFVVERTGDLDEAARLYDEAYAVYVRALGADHLFPALVMVNRSRMRELQGDFQTADSLLLASLAIQRERFGGPHPRIARGIWQRGRLYLKQHDYAKAEALYRQALAMQEALLPPDHRHIAETKSTLGAALAGEGRYAEAGALLREGYEGLKATLGEDHRATREARERLDAFHEAGH